MGRSHGLEGFQLHLPRLVCALGEAGVLPVPWIWDVKGVPGGGGDDTPPPNIPEGTGVGDTQYSSTTTNTNTTIVANTREAAAVTATIAWQNNRGRF